MEVITNKSFYYNWNQIKLNTICILVNKINYGFLNPRLLWYSNVMYHKFWLFKYYWLYDCGLKSNKIEHDKYYDIIVIVIVNCDCLIWIELKLKSNKIEYDTLLWDYSYCDCECLIWIELKSNYKIE